MATERVERRLAAILAADIAGYSRLMGADEEGTLARLRAHRCELIDLKIAEHRGRVVKTTGDGILVEFGSVVDALRSGSEIQRGIAERNAETAVDSRIEFRIGIHQGDIIIEDGDIFGDGVNVAARLEGLADPGGICVSARVQEDAAGKLDLAFEDMGEQSLKNIARPVRAFRVVTAAGLGSAQRRRLLPSPTSRRSRYCRSPIRAATRSRNISPTAWSRRSSPRSSPIRWLFVIGRNSSFIYHGQAIA